MVEAQEDPFFLLCESRHRQSEKPRERKRQTQRARETEREREKKIREGEEKNPESRVMWN